MKIRTWGLIMGGTLFWGGLTTSALAKPMQQDGAKPQSPTETPKEAKPSQPRPGKDRWLVKTASDPDAVKIKKNSQETTIERMLMLSRPKEMPLDGSNPDFQEKRAKPVETTIYSVEADIVECKSMPDGDYRVVLRGASGKTLILEMPDPAFVKEDSPFFYGIKAVREQFEQRFKPETTPKTVQAHARITGIGFFGRAYGKTKPEGNLVQIHPVLLVDWMEQPSKEFAKTVEKEHKKQETAPKPKNP